MRARAFGRSRGTVRIDTAVLKAGLDVDLLVVKAADWTAHKRANKRKRKKKKKKNDGQETREVYGNVCQPRVTAHSAQRTVHRAIAFPDDMVWYSLQVRFARS